MRNYIFVLLILFAVPAAAHAAVLINEVAWMGTNANANAEWIELTNSGSASVDLTGWKLVAASGSPNITLSGSIAAGGYFLLERTSDDTAPGVTADQIYTGALTNSGTTLSLADTGGGTVDTVAGGANWATIGGDNTTKDTAQRTASGWTTAPGTPRAANSGTAGSSTTSSSSTTNASSTSSSASTYTPPPSNLSVAIEGDASVLLEMPVTFSARVKMKSGAADPTAQISWSFGDGSAGSGESVEKIFHYPGTYLVTARAEDGTASASDELLVTATASAVAIAAVSGEGITLENQSRDRLDLSGWRITAGTGIFRIPKGTQLLPSARMLFPNAITNLPISFEALLFYPDGVLAARYALTPAPEVMQPIATTTGSREVQGEQSPVPVITSAPSHATTAVSAPTTATELAAVGAAQPPAAPAPEESASATSPLIKMASSPWSLGFLGVLAVSFGAFILL